MDKKMIRMIEIVVGVFLVFIIFLALIASCSTKKTSGGYTYEKLEEKMMTIAKTYYTANPKELPAESGDSKTYTLKKMISDGELSEVTELFGNENMKCEGSITVTNNNDLYVYNPYLNCSAGKDDKYETVSLSNKIIEDGLVETGVGLYEAGDEYYYRGEVKNNYVIFDGDTKNVYRIIGITSDGYIRLMYSKGPSSGSTSWDNRTTDNRYSGINDFVTNGIASRVKEKLDSIFESSTEWSNTKIKAYVVPQSVCIGKRLETDTTHDGSTECASKYEGQNLSLIATYEFLRISLDENCSETTSKYCKNYNWISSQGRGTWTITGDASLEYKVYKISGSELRLSNASNSSNILPVFNIVGNAVYKDGDGTQDDPYVIYVAPDIKTSKKKTTTTKK